MILGSGAGNHLSFPGISGIQELKILAKILKPSEGLFLIPTRNSCSYLGTAYNGTLAVGKEANLLILKENPVKNIDALFQIEQVIQNGKLLRFDSLPAKKLPKKK
jgi:imidazolonepropionase-like amidohydrolase